MLRTHEGTLKHFGEKNATCDCYRSNQMPSTDQIIHIAPYMRTSFIVTNISKYTVSYAIFIVNLSGNDFVNIHYFPFCKVCNKNTIENIEQGS